MGLFGITKQELLNKIEDLEYTIKKPSSFNIGDKYNHKDYGNGIIVSVELHTSRCMDLVFRAYQYEIYFDSIKSKKYIYCD